MLMPFGKHRGVEVSDLPDKYLCWLIDEVELFGQLRLEVEREYTRRLFCAAPKTVTTTTISIAPQDVELVRLVVDRGYRAVAKIFHPDAGGDAQKMVRLNAVAESLRSQLASLEVL